MAQTHDAPYYATFHSCMFGGQRPKTTTFAANFKEMLELTAECDRPMDMQRAKKWSIHSSFARS